MLRMTNSLVAPPEAAQSNQREQAKQHSAAALGRAAATATAAFFGGRAGRLAGVGVAVTIAGLGLLGRRGWRRRRTLDAGVGRDQAHEAVGAVLVGEAAAV